jgi:translation initiation factor 2 alpha subunit (eIF-2alpha)
MRDETNGSEHEKFIAVLRRLSLYQTRRQCNLSRKSITGKKDQRSFSTFYRRMKSDSFLLVAMEWHPPTKR